MRRSRRIAVLLGFLVLVGLTGAVSAVAPPQPLCEPCSDEVVNDSAVEQSTAAIAIDDAGTGHWTVTLDLRENATVDPASVHSAAQERVTGHRDEPEPRNLSVTVAGDQVTFTFEIPGMGHRSAGDVLVVDYFYSHGDPDNRLGVNADRVVVTGPEGTTLTSGPRWLRANDSAIVLSGDHGQPWDRSISRGWYLAFGPDEGVDSKIAATLGIGIDKALATVGDLPGAALLPMLVLGTFLVVLRRRGDRLAERSRRFQLGIVTALATLLSIGALLVTALIGGWPFGSLVPDVERSVASFLLVGTFAGTPTLFVVAGAVTAQVALFRSRFDIEFPGVGHLEAGAVVAGLALLGGVLAAGTDSRVSVLYAGIVGLLVPLLFLPLSLAERRPVRRLLAATIVCSPVLLGFGFGPFGGGAATFLPITYVPWAVVASSVGSLAYLYGRSSREQPAAAGE